MITEGDRLAKKHLVIGTLNVIARTQEQIAHLKELSGVWLKLDEAWIELNNHRKEFMTNNKGDEGIMK